MNEATQLLDQLRAVLEKPVSTKRDRSYIHDMTAGERIADAVAAGMGSWRFIIIQTVIVLLWMVLNVVGFIGRWDSYPFILLNLLFSTQAAYAAPIIMMSQNRASAKDHIRDDHEAAEVEDLFQINQQQLTILRQQSEILALLKGQSTETPASIS